MCVRALVFRNTSKLITTGSWLLRTGHLIARPQVTWGHMAGGVCSRKDSAGGEKNGHARGCDDLIKQVNRVAVFCNWMEYMPRSRVA
ncbi:hypothetical protein BaRGS_00029751 [Batillaria attramentaria]|uniref:Secreted protein n=1 Tax=Batillaria attramentaria TaxID=370345 RepID=A0ABD0JWK8_9CAEN